MSGIAAHKNEYTHGVLIKNYVEDTIGGELSKATRPVEAPAKSQSRTDFPRYSNNVYAENAAVMPSATRDSGMSFAEMFGHRGAPSPREKYGGTGRGKVARQRAKAAMTADPYQTASKNASLAMEKSKKRLQQSGKQVLSVSHGRTKGEFSNQANRF